MSINETVDKYIEEETNIEKKVKQHNISIKYGKKGIFTRPPEGYIKNNKGEYIKVDDKTWEKKIGKKLDYRPWLLSLDRMTDKERKKSISDAYKRHGKEGLDSIIKDSSKDKENRYRVLGKKLVKWVTDWKS